MRMHACMLAADPPLRYLQGRTLDVMDRVEAMRGRGLSVWYTMDAGPHVKVLCHADDLNAIVRDLSELVDPDDLIIAKPGIGAGLLES